MGKFGDYISQSFPPKPAFSVADIPDLEGKVIIVTGMCNADTVGRRLTRPGGNSGIGYEITQVCYVVRVAQPVFQYAFGHLQVLLRKNARVYMASRSKEKAEAAIAALHTETGKEAIFLKLDVSSMESVRHATEEFQE